MMSDWILVLLGVLISLISAFVIWAGLLMLQRLNKHRAIVQKQLRQLAQMVSHRHQAHAVLEKQVAQLQVKLQETSLGLDRFVSDAQLNRLHQPLDYKTVDYKKLATVLARGQADADTLLSMGYSRSEAHLLSQIARNKSVMHQ